MTYVCVGCGRSTGDPLLLTCPAARPGDDVDHVLSRVAMSTAPPDDDPNPFVRWRRRLPSHAFGDDASFVDLVRRLDDRVAAVDGRGFHVTPLVDAAARGVLAKDETGQVSGSHKARHLMGVLLHLERAGRSGPLAIASCGNAALAAALLAKAAGRSLAVYIPPTADLRIVDRLRSLGAAIHVCARRSGERGDPCYLRFREAVAAGAIPFCCQGNVCAPTIDGGRTLGYEMVEELGARRLDRLFVQVGGGALASATVQAFEEAGRLPRIHAVQTRAAFPLRRAWETLSARILGDGGGDDAERADRLHRVPSEDLDAALRHAARHRSEYMRPWPEEPRSIAQGILDDETYDWLAIVRATIRSGGFPVVVADDRLKQANRLAVAETGIPVDHTGSAGLAGVLELRAAGQIEKGESVAVIFSGRRR